MAKYEALGNAIESAVRKACEGKEVGIAFSGGMDSGLIVVLAKNCARSVICYTLERPCPELVRTGIRLRFAEPN